MGGRDKAAEKRNADIAQAQFNLMQQQTAASDARMKRADEMRAPAIDYAKSVIQNPRQTMSATQGGLFDIDQGLKASIQSIMDTVPEGAARDYALTQVRAMAPVQRQQQLHNSFLQALNLLSGFGSEDTGTAFQQLGAGMRGGEAGANTNQQLIQAAAQRQANMFGMIGQIGGMAGQMAGMKWGK